VSRAPALAALAAVVALMTTACVQLWPLPALENGRIPDRAMTEITPQCRVLDAVAPRLVAMLAAAKADGVGLAPETSSYLPPGVAGPPRIESCYRSYEMQAWWRTYYCSIGKCQDAAVPGTSKHGLGRAVDFEDQDGELTFRSPGYVWLGAHAAQFGFFQPPSVQEGSSGEEAWHWEAQVDQ